MARTLRLAAGVAAILIATAPAALAHPLGNFTVNRFAGLEISPEQIVVRYTVDLAEVPTFQEIAKIDTDRNGAVSDDELSAYATAKAAFLADGIRLTIDGEQVAPATTAQRASLDAGEGGLQTLWLDATFTAPLSDGVADVHYVDVNFGALPGWKEVVASATGGATLYGSDVPAESMSDGLRRYPNRVMKSLPDVTTARLRLAPGGSAAAAPPLPAPAAGNDTATRLFGREFASLVERDLTLPAVAIALVLALAFGALHALGPGHGKTVMAAYLVGSEAGFRQALAVGAAVSAMHTTSVIGMGLVALLLAEVLPPAAVYPWLTLGSGVAIGGLGAWMLRVRWRARKAAHEHAHHMHDSSAASPHPFSRKGLAAIALSGGLVPSPTAVVVLLGAIALHRIAFGVMLVVAFSIGLAAALGAIGALVLRARTFAAARWKLGTSLVPSLSSAAVFALGCFLTVRAALTLTA